MGREHIQRSDGKGTNRQTGKITTSKLTLDKRKRNQKILEEHKPVFTDETRPSLCCWTGCTPGVDCHHKCGVVITEVYWNPQGSQGFEDNIWEYVEIANVRTDGQPISIQSMVLTSQDYGGSEYNRMKWYCDGYDPNKDFCWSTMKSGNNYCADEHLSGQYLSFWPGEVMVVARNTSTWIGEDWAEPCVTLFQWGPEGTTSTISNNRSILRLYEWDPQYNTGECLLDEVSICSGPGSEGCDFQSPGDATGGSAEAQGSVYRTWGQEARGKVELYDWLTSEEQHGTPGYINFDPDFEQCHYQDCGEFTNMDFTYCADVINWIPGLGYVGEFCPQAPNKAVRNGIVTEYCNQYYACGHRECPEGCESLESHCVYMPYSSSCNKCDPSYNWNCDGTPIEGGHTIPNPNERGPGRGTIVPPGDKNVGQYRRGGKTGKGGNTQTFTGITKQEVVQKITSAYGTNPQLNQYLTDIETKSQDEVDAWWNCTECGQGDAPGLCWTSQNACCRGRVNYNYHTGEVTSWQIKCSKNIDLLLR